MPDTMLLARCIIGMFPPAVKQAAFQSRGGGWLRALTCRSISVLPTSIAAYVVGVEISYVMRAQAFCVWW
jgi:hypothetical protein